MVVHSSSYVEKTEVFRKLCASNGNKKLGWGGRIIFSPYHESPPINGGEL
jgi:hypothetical protein